ncbi:hypothetical protein AMTR_s00108p00103690 [Amborella trichopoda]|uniref:Uncharacterized protein n=1 Tax=Amborella trichopoda TaxID=13333 RepID=W1NXC9_AMBTC|nr:hypothetical protein AMTR_s00108p00103690 [Amborella trichopoda]
MSKETANSNQVVGFTCFSFTLVFTALMASSMASSTNLAPWVALSHLLRHQFDVSGPHRVTDAGECFVLPHFLKSTRVGVASSSCAGVTKALGFEDNL